MLKLKSAMTMGLLIAPVMLSAQTRETGDVGADGTSMQAPQAANSSSQLSLGHDSLTTGMTAARAALGPGDLLEIGVFDSPELTQRVRIDSDGKIKLALIGEIPVQGMSPDALQSLMAQKLVTGKFVKDPQVALFVVEYANQMAYVTGEVARPGAYPLLRSHRLRDLLSVTGGLTARAGNIITIKRDGAAPQTIAVDLSDPDENKSNPLILPGDNISAGQTGIVYVLGDVGRPGGFLIDRRAKLSVVQALALAEGTTATASLGKARLIRDSPQGRQEIALDLKSILKSESADVILQAGDVVFVPGSVTRGIGRRSLDTLLATAGGVAVYSTIR
ncbi:MAG TPA: polysaccharide biosynthesis/export family protein [Acidisarcina sp.]